MKNNNKEIEIQVQVERIEPLETFLKKEAKFRDEQHQEDEYFTPAHRDFTKPRPINEWLRIRKVDEKNSIAYKFWHYGKTGKSLYGDEYEFGIDAPTKMKKIFELLDFKSVTVVDKKRHTWLYQDYKVSIDEIKNLGDFVEVEYASEKDVDPEEITDKMVGWLKEIGCGEIKRNHSGYPFMLLFPDEIRYDKDVC